jgi:cardiolipin synthase
MAVLPAFAISSPLASSNLPPFFAVGCICLPLSFQWLNTSLTLLAVLVQLLGIALSLRAILEARTPQSAIGWTLGLVLFPIAAIPLYLVFGQSKFTGYILAGQGIVPALDEAKLRAKMIMEAHRCSFRTELESLTRLSERLTGLPTTTGNNLDLLINGKQTFEAIFEGIRRAKHYVLVQFYIINDDETGRALRDELLAARRRGVEVYVLYDGVGSKHLPSSYAATLRAAGVRVSPFVTNRELGVRFQINFRNHRKLVLIDGNEAFTGGLNAGDEYMGKNPKFGPWRDTHVHLRGPAILPLLIAFMEDWYYATGAVPHLPLHEPPIAGGCKVLSFASGPADEIEICPVIYLSAIRAARNRIWIASPYFVPDTATRFALQHAALSGVDVRVLLPGMADHTLPWLSAYAYYPSMRLAGVRIYRLREGFMHQKVLLVDNHLAMVGSINFDHRSFFLNFEHAVLANDSGFALAVQQMLVQDFSRAAEEDLFKYEAGSFWFRLKVRLASLSSPEQ